MPGTRHRINATVTASGGASQAWYTPRIQSGGYIESIVFQNGNTNSASGISTAGHITIRGGESSQLFLSVTTTGATGSVVTWFPRGAAVDASGALYSPATGAGAVLGFPQHFTLAQEPIKIEVTSAGVASAGKFFRLDIYVRGGE